MIHPVVGLAYFSSSFECMLFVAIVVEGQAECPKLALAMKLIELRDRQASARYTHYIFL